MADNSGGQGEGQNREELQTVERGRRYAFFLDNCEVLDFLESKAGRVAFKLPDPK